MATSRAKSPLYVRGHTAVCVGKEAAGGGGVHGNNDDEMQPLDMLTSSNTTRGSGAEAQTTSGRGHCAHSTARSPRDNAKEGCRGWQTMSGS